jgi:hypothetical protein
MIDEDEVHEFRDIVGCGSVVTVPPRQPHHQVQYQWQANKYEDVKHVILLLEPWLGQRRLVQAINALAADTRKVSHGAS